MGGGIEVESEKDVGSKFYFTIKCKTPTDEQLRVFFSTKTDDGGRRSGELTENKEVRKMHLLIVEDNLINQKLIRKILEQKGHACIIANNGSEAVEHFKRHHFDLIFMVSENF